MATQPTPTLPELTDLHAVGTHILRSSDDAVVCFVSGGAVMGPGERMAYAKMFAACPALVRLVHKLAVAGDADARQMLMEIAQS